MINAFIDLHIHSALSPCAEPDMTPGNIVNMAQLKGLDFIAIADHNAIGNVKPTMRVAETTSLIVIPAIEITTEEEVHVLAYFSTLSQLESFYEFLEPYLPEHENRPDIFGEQHLYDENDQWIGTDSRLLMNAFQLSFDTLIEKILFFEGVAVPAHVNRGSFSVMSNLGFIPPELPITTVEIIQPGVHTTKSQNFETQHHVRQIISSDAHSLGEILEAVFFVELEALSTDCLLKWLHGE